MGFRSNALYEVGKGGIWVLRGIRGLPLAVVPAAVVYTLAHPVQLSLQCPAATAAPGLTITVRGAGVVLQHTPAASGGHPR